MQRSQVNIVNECVFSRLILNCEDAFSIIFSFLPLRHLLMGVMPSCSYFSNFILSRTPLSLRIDFSKPESVPIDTLYGKYRVRELRLYRSREGIRAGIRAGPIASLMESKKDDIRVLKIAQLQHCGLENENANQDSNWSLSSPSPIERKNLKDIIYDKIGLCKRLEYLSSYVLPSDILQLTNLKKLVIRFGLSSISNPGVYPSSIFGKVLDSDHTSFEDAVQRLNIFKTYFTELSKRDNYSLREIKIKDDPSRMPSFSAASKKDSKKSLSFIEEFLDSIARLTLDSFSSDLMFEELIGFSKEFINFLSRTKRFYLKLRKHNDNPVMNVIPPEKEQKEVFETVGYFTDAMKRMTSTKHTHGYDLLKKVKRMPGIRYIDLGEDPSLKNVRIRWMQNLIRGCTDCVFRFSVKDSVLEVDENYRSPVDEKLTDITLMFARFNLQRITKAKGFIFDLKFGSNDLYNKSNPMLRKKLFDVFSKLIEEPKLEILAFRTTYENNKNIVTGDWLSSDFSLDQFSFDLCKKEKDDDDKENLFCTFPKFVMSELMSLESVSRICLKMLRFEILFFPTVELVSWMKNLENFLGETLRFIERIGKINHDGSGNSGSCMLDKFSLEIVVNTTDMMGKDMMMVFEEFGKVQKIVEDRLKLIDFEKLGWKSVYLVLSLDVWRVEGKDEKRKMSFFWKQ